MATVPAEALLWRPGPNKWSVHEVVVHCADSDTTSVERVRYVVGESRPAIMGHDQDAWARTFDYHAYPPDVAWAQVEVVRRCTYELSRRFPEEYWSCEGTHSEVGRVRRERSAGRRGSRKHQPTKRPRLLGSARICALEIQYEDRTGVGTGWLAGPRTVITAGHCVFERGRWALHVHVSPGRDGARLPHGRIEATRFQLRTVDRWRGEENPEYDLGAIQLDVPIGNDIGWFSFRALPREKLETRKVHISGYTVGGNWKQRRGSERLARVTRSRVFYDIDTVKGQSGAPVWLQASDRVEPVVVGIHNYGVSANWKVPLPSGARITTPIAKLIAEWVREID